MMKPTATTDARFRFDVLNAKGVRVRWVGRRPRLWRTVIRELEVAEEPAQGGILDPAVPDGVQLHRLRGCDVHSTTILGSVDEGIFRSLGVQVTSEPVFTQKSLYRKH